MQNRFIKRGLSLIALTHSYITHFGSLHVLT
jgi:hypothetical protein